MSGLNKLLNYLMVLVVLAIAASFFYFNDSKRKSGGGQPKLADSEVDKVVNKYIQQVNNQNEINKMKIEAALLEAKKKVLADRASARLKEEKEVQNIPMEKQMWTEAELKAKAKEMGGFTGSKPAPQPAPAVEEEWDVKKMTKAEKEEYIRQYTENARKGGFQIELNDQLEVIRATPIRKPSQQNDSYNGSQTD